MPRDFSVKSFEGIFPDGVDAVVKSGATFSSETEALTEIAKIQKLFDEKRSRDRKAELIGQTKAGVSGRPEASRVSDLVGRVLRSSGVLGAGFQTPPAAAAIARPETEGIARGIGLRPQEAIQFDALAEDPEFAASLVKTVSGIASERAKPIEAAEAERARAEQESQLESLTQQLNAADPGLGDRVRAAVKSGQAHLFPTFETSVRSARAASQEAAQSRTQAQAEAVKTERQDFADIQTGALKTAEQFRASTAESFNVEQEVTSMLQRTFSQAGGEAAIFGFAMEDRPVIQKLIKESLSGLKVKVQELPTDQEINQALADVVALAPTIEAAVPALIGSMTQAAQQITLANQALDEVQKIRDEEITAPLQSRQELDVLIARGVRTQRTLARKLLVGSIIASNLSLVVQKRRLSAGAQR